MSFRGGVEERITLSERFDALDRSGARGGKRRGQVVQVGGRVVRNARGNNAPGGNRGVKAARGRGEQKQGKGQQQQQQKKKKGQQGGDKKKKPNQPKKKKAREERKPMTKEQLDKQMEEYAMGNKDTAKDYLDLQLEAYNRNRDAAAASADAPAAAPAE